MTNKRESNLNQVFNSKRKKFQKTNNKTLFENLSNEIYYEIFDYLDGYTIYKSFSNLNIRFQQLINSSLLSLRILFHDNISQIDFNYFQNQIIIPNKHRIISLHLQNSKIIKTFFQFNILDSSFNRLESIELCRVKPSKFLSILPTFQSLSRLFKLSIELTDHDNINLEQIYSIILQLSSLKYLFLSSDGYYRLNSLKSSFINERFSKIETLIIDHYCTINGLISILHFTTQLKRLTCLHLFESRSDKLNNEISINLPYLTYVDFAICSVEFNNLEYIIKKIGFQLKSLEIWSSYDHNYPNQWKQLILKHMPHLHKCNIYYPMNINNNLQDFDSDTFIHQFNSSFWFERNWNITIGIEYEKIFYQISSNKYFEKQCNNKNMKILTYSNENNNYRGININRYINDNLSISISSPIKLSITNSGTVKWFGSIVNKLCPVLNLIQIRSLHLIWPNISINDFVELLSHLPHLDSLTWFSSIKIDMNQLSTKDEENLRLLSINNNIKKVSQEIDFKQIQFLINLCPRMEEFEVRGVINDDLEEFIRFIFIENNLNIVHLHSLHLNIIDINDETVNKLQNLIYSEHLLSNYIIKYVGSYIVLKWKIQ